MKDSSGVWKERSITLGQSILSIIKIKKRNEYV